MRLVKILLAGTAVALTAGVMLGGAMRPELAVGDRPGGPQMFANWSGTRSTGPFDPGTTFVSYPSSAPDYLLGTDSKRRMAWPDEQAATSQPATAVEPEAPAVAAPAQAPTVLTRAVYDEPAPATGGYPSLGGASHAAAAASSAQPAPDDTTLPVDG